MKRETFIERFATANSTIDTNQIASVLTNSIESNLYDGNPRGHRNLIIVMEELAELSTALSKVLRDKGDLVNTLEELADVQIGIYYVQEICGITNEELQKAINVKIDNLQRALAEHGTYK